MRRSTATAALLTALLAGCGSGGGSASSNRGSPAAPVRVEISGYAYHPAMVRVSAGTKITFTNVDSTAHTATSTTRGFDTGTLTHGQSATVTVTAPGTYTFYCQFHAFMRATLVVH